MISELSRPSCVVKIEKALKVPGIYDAHVRFNSGGYDPARQNDFRYRCWTDCPDVFEEDDKDGWSRIVEKFQVAGDLGRGEVLKSLRKAAQAAADDYPVSLIHVEWTSNLHQPVGLRMSTRTASAGSIPRAALRWVTAWGRSVPVSSCRRRRIVSICLTDLHGLTAAHDPYALPSRCPWGHTGFLLQASPLRVLPFLRGMPCSPFAIDEYRIIDGATEQERYTAFLSRLAKSTFKATREGGNACLSTSTGKTRRTR